MDSLAVAREILSPFGLQVFQSDADEPVVDVVAAQVCVAVGGQDFEDAIMQLEDRDVERAARFF